MSEGPQGGAIPGPAAEARSEALPPPEEREVHLRDYLAVLRKHLPVLAAVVVVAVGATAAVTFRQTPIYRATAQLNIRRDPPPGGGLESTWAWITTQREHMETQNKLMRSRAVARTAIESLRRLGKLPAAAAGASDDRHALDAFLAGVEVRAVKDSFLVNVSYVGPDPAECARNANAVVDAFIEESAARQTNTAQEKIQKIREELPRAQERLRAAQESLQKFQEQNEVLNFEDYRRLTQANLAKLHSTLVDVQSSRRVAESRHLSVSRIRADGGDLTGLPSVAESRVLENYRHQEILLEQERLALAGRFKADHPSARAVEEKLAAVREKIRGELSGIVRRIETEFEERKFQEQDLERGIERERSALRDLERKAKDHDLMQGEVTRAKSDYDSLAEQQNQIQQSSSVNLNSATVVDRAEVPEFPVKPDPALNLMLAGLLGIVGGVGLSFLLEYLDDRLRTAEEVERALGLPVIGGVPRFSEGASDEEHDLVTFADPKAGASESFRALRTALLFSPSARAARHLVVTSAAAGEGKTVVSTNLAIALAQGGGRVLLLEADLRRPRVAKTFGIAPTPGLADLLAGRAPIEGALRTTKVENLTVLPAGTIPENPSELLGTAAMAGLLRDLSRRYDRVVVDTPPVLVVTDPCVVAALADATVQVVSARQVSRSVARRGAEALRRVGARVVGAVLTKVPAGSREYGDYAYYYYAGAADARREGAGTAEPRG
ncbi:MAG: polysaccharide biosynthesis tyrosine autokinase [Planctomycetales bacterium]|nr:polysaccharide biosynthesis tyrosine autokinase [Planctomycetales bacterium]